MAESIFIPVLSYSESIISFSIIISAPVFALASSTVALVISLTVLSVKRLFLSFCSSKGIMDFTIFLRPSYSSALLNSGWKTIITAVMPIAIVLLKIQSITLISSRYAKR